MRSHAIRLTYGMDLKEEIEKFAKENNIQAGCIVSAVGCLNKLVLRTAGAKSIETIENDFEIVSATGTISKDGCHIHIAVSDDKLKTYGGHLKKGCIINTTVELILLEFDDIIFTREMDEETGYKELVIKNIPITNQNTIDNYKKSKS